jgi:quercetin dioxygenase-like cupin family protein
MTDKRLAIHKEVSMKRSLLLPMFAVAALALGGCPAQPATAPPTPPIGGPVARAVELPVAAGPGGPREVRVLVDEPALKLVTIILRQGTALPEHHSPVPVVIQALQGAGTVTAGTEHFRVDPAHAVLLAPNVPHAVAPDDGTDLVLLVQHLGRGEEARP